MNEKQAGIRAMRLAFAGTLAITLVKFLAYWLTHTNSILTDAIESIINVAAGLFALYSLSIAALPRDQNHPYGHGKIEFFAAGFEGGLITITGVLILIKAVYNIYHPQTIHSIDWGLGLIILSGLSNWFLGRYLVKKGKQLHSLTLESDGEHLLTDTYSSAFLAAGLAVIYFTNWVWVDNAAAIGLSLMILYSGIGLIRKSVAGLMDETDEEIIQKLADAFNQNRIDEWIDIHNLRAQRYGSEVHVDAHVTLPRFQQFEETHQHITALEKTADAALPNQIEVFLFPEPCTPDSCPLCSLSSCPVREKPFVAKIRFTPENLIENKPHHTIN